MVRNVVADFGLDSEVAALCDRDEEFISGFVVGQTTPNEDIFVHFAPTPVAGNGNGDSENDDALAPTKIDDLDVGWMEEHYKQIERLLPGGINVVGAFFVTADVENVFQSAVGNAHLRKLLKYLATRSPDMKSIVLVSIDKTRGKSTECRHVDRESAMAASVSNFQSLKSSAVTFTTEAPLKWQRLRGEFLLDFSSIFDETATEEWLLGKKIDSALEPVRKIVDSAVVIFDDNYLPLKSFLDPTVKAEVESSNKKSKKDTKKKPNKGKKRGRKVSETDEDEDDEEDHDDGYEDGLIRDVSVDILLQEDVNLDLAEAADDDCKVLKVGSRMKVLGRMAIIAFLHSRATIEEAVAAVQQDMFRSLKGRCLMHCDSLVGEETLGGGEEAGEGVPTLHEPPRRISIKLPSSAVAISDYLYPGENVEDSTESVEEIFGFKPRIEDMDDELELIAGPRDTMIPPQNSDADSDAGSDRRADLPPRNLEEATRCNPTVLLVSLGVALVAIGLSYYFIL